MFTTKLTLNTAGLHESRLVPPQKSRSAKCGTATILSVTLRYHKSFMQIIQRYVLEADCPNTRPHERDVSRHGLTLMDFIDTW